MGRIVIITGCPGTGKSTAAAQAASHSPLEKSVYLHTDTFYDAPRSAPSWTKRPTRSWWKSCGPNSKSWARMKGM